MFTSIIPSYCFKSQTFRKKALKMKTNRTKLGYHTSKLEILLDVFDDKPCSEDIRSQGDLFLSLEVKAQLFPLQEEHEGH